MSESNNSRNAGSDESQRDADEIFYDESLTLEEKRARIRAPAEQGDTNARSYLGSLLRVERIARGETEPAIPEHDAEQGGGDGGRGVGGGASRGAEEPQQGGGEAEREPPAER